MAAGELTTDEASAAASVIEMHRRAIETTGVGYVQTPLGAVLAITAVAVFYFWAINLASSAKRLAGSAPGLELYPPS